MLVCVLRAIVEILLSVTNFSEVGYSFQPNNYDDVGGMRHTFLLTFTTKKPHNSWKFKLVSAYILANRSPLNSQHQSEQKILSGSVGTADQFHESKKKNPRDVNATKSGSR